MKLLDLIERVEDRLSLLEKRIDAINLEREELKVAVKELYKQNLKLKNDGKKRGGNSHNKK